MKLDQNSITKLRSFFKKQSAAEPIIDKTNRAIRIKDYTVEKQNKEWVVKLGNNNILCQFSYQSWALAWIVAMVNNDRLTCDYLVKNNKYLSTLQLDKTLYRYYQTNTVTDHKKQAIIDSRISDTSQNIHELVWDTHQVLRYQGFV